MKITKAFVDKAAPPTNKDQIFYRDEQLKGFALRVTAAGAKSFIVETLIGNKVRRMTLGRYGKLTVEQARNEAKKLLGKIATGIDPIAEKRVQKIKGISLRQAFNDYIAARKSLKPTTIIDYHRVLKQVVPDWLDKPLHGLNKDLVAKRHTRHGENKSRARANLAMRLLRAIFNFAMNHYDGIDGKAVILENPVKALSHTRAWYRIERRQGIIKSHQLADWYLGLQRLSENRSLINAEMWQDYFLLILFTGLRRQEAASISWANVDLKSKTFVIPDPKNRNQHTLPMSDFLYQLFLRRKLASDGNYVFSTKDSNTGHIVEPRKAMLRVSELCGIGFTVHDLRRTFITTAESLDISAYALKRLMNHKMNNDVTAGYIVNDVERLRKPMQQITDYLFKCMDINGSQNIKFKTNRDDLALEI